MKVLISLAILFSGTFASAEDFALCTEQSKQDRCRAEAKTCKAFDQCQIETLNKLNSLVMKAIDALEGDKVESCREARNNLEDSIWSHYTTIECTDTPNGPQFGG